MGQGGGVELPGEADVENGAEWMCGKRSALHVPTQRAAMTDAACCDGRCTALRHLPENTMVRRAARMGGGHTRILRPAKAACG